MNEQFYEDVVNGLQDMLNSSSENPSGSVMGFTILFPLHRPNEEPIAMMLAHNMAGYEIIGVMTLVQEGVVVELQKGVADSQSEGDIEG
jgi:hypothetical protein